MLDPCTANSGVLSCVSSNCTFLPTIQLCVTIDRLCWSLTSSQCTAKWFCQWSALMDRCNFNPVIYNQTQTIPAHCPTLPIGVTVMLVLLVVTLVASIIIICVVTAVNNKRVEEEEREAEEEEANQVLPDDL
jgi:hypothetical protein